MTPLTKTDIIAMRTAERAYIHIDSDKSTITFCKRLPRVKSVFKTDDDNRDREASYVLEVGAWIGQDERAFFSCWRTGAWQAIARIVRPGDTFTLRAYPNNNQYLEHAGLFYDECVLTISRIDQKGHRRSIVEDLLVGTSTCPDNSARAIQKKQYTISA